MSSRRWRFPTIRKNEANSQRPFQTLSPSRSLCLPASIYISHAQITSQVESESSHQFRIDFCFSAIVNPTEKFIQITNLCQVPSSERTSGRDKLIIRVINRHFSCVLELGWWGGTDGSLSGMRHHRQILLVSFITITTAPNYEDPMEKLRPFGLWPVIYVNWRFPRFDFCAHSNLLDSSSVWNSLAPSSVKNFRSILYSTHCPTAAFPVNW